MALLDQEQAGPLQLAAGDRALLGERVALGGDEGDRRHVDLGVDQVLAGRVGFGQVGDDRPSGFAAPSGDDDVLHDGRLGPVHTGRDRVLCGR